MDTTEYENYNSNNDDDDEKHVPPEKNVSYLLQKIAYDYSNANLVANELRQRNHDVKYLFQLLQELFSKYKKQEQSVNDIFHQLYKIIDNNDTLSFEELSQLTSEYNHIKDDILSFQNYILTTTSNQSSSSQQHQRHQSKSTNIDANAFYAPFPELFLKAFYVTGSKCEKFVNTFYVLLCGLQSRQTIFFPLLDKTSLLTFVENDFTKDLISVYHLAKLEQSIDRESNKENAEAIVDNVTLEHIEIHLPGNESRLVKFSCNMNFDKNNQFFIISGKFILKLYNRIEYNDDTSAVLCFFCTSEFFNCLQKKKNLSDNLKFGFRKKDNSQIHDTDSRSLLINVPSLSKEQIDLFNTKRKNEEEEVEEEAEEEAEEEEEEDKKDEAENEMKCTNVLSTSSHALHSSFRKLRSMSDHVVELKSFFSQLKIILILYLLIYSEEFTIQDTTILPADCIYQLFYEINKLSKEDEEDEKNEEEEEEEEERRRQQISEFLNQVTTHCMECIEHSIPFEENMNLVEYLENHSSVKQILLKIQSFAIEKFDAFKMFLIYIHASKNHLENESNLDQIFFEICENIQCISYLYQLNIQHEDFVDDKDYVDNAYSMNFDIFCRSCFISYGLDIQFQSCYPYITQANLFHYLCIENIPLHSNLSNDQFCSMIQILKKFKKESILQLFSINLYLPNMDDLFLPCDSSISNPFTVSLFHLTHSKTNTFYFVNFLFFLLMSYCHSRNFMVNGEEEEEEEEEAKKNLKNIHDNLTTEYILDSIQFFRTSITDVLINQHLSLIDIQHSDYDDNEIEISNNNNDRYRYSLLLPIYKFPTRFLYLISLLQSVLNEFNQHDHIKELYDDIERREKISSTWLKNNIVNEIRT